MKKYVSLLILLVISMIIPATSVNAATAGERKDAVDFNTNHNASVSGWDASEATNIGVFDIGALIDGRTPKARTKYYDSLIRVDMGGETYEGFCLDPQIPRPSGPMKCEPMSENPAAHWLVNEAFSESGIAEGYSHEEVLLAFRFLSVMQGTSFGGDDEELSIVKTGLDYYVALRDFTTDNTAIVEQVRTALENAGLCGEGEGKVDCNYRYDMANFIVQSSVPSWDENDILFDAYWLARRAKSNGNYGSVTDEEQAGSFMIENWDYFTEGTHHEYKLRSTGKIPKDQLEVVCTGCSKEPKVVWNENSNFGWIELDIAEGVCEYTVDLYYPLKGGYVCESTESGNYQSLFINVQTEVVGLAQTLKGYVGTEECGGGCCREKPEIQPNYIVGNVNNCCDATHSQASQYKLNDLFCEDTTLDVKYYRKKCNVDSYMHNETPVNDFCEVYCTERVSVDLPGAITAVSGRYFTLTPNPVGSTTSAYIEGYKRCRVWIDYEKFDIAYQAAIKNEAAAYNEVQRLRALERLFEQTNPGPTTGGELVTDTISAHASGSCRCNCETTCTGEGSSRSCTTTCDYDSSSGDASGTVSYYKWEFPEIEQEYYKIDIEAKDHDKGAQKKYEKLTLKYSSTDESKHSRYSFYQYEQAVRDAEAIRAQARAECVAGFTICSCGCSSSRDSFEGEGTPHTSEYVPTTYSQLKTDISNAVDSYNAAARAGKKVEEDLFTCTDYFESGNPGSNARAMYKFNATQKFSYSQTYLDETAKLVNDIILVPFKNTPGCIITGPTIGREGIGFEGEIIEPQYTSYYSPNEDTKKFEIMIDMGETTLAEMTLQEDKDGFEQFFDEEFEAEKHATIDGRYRAVCQWEENDNKFYTLAHSGFTDRSSASMTNKTIHERQYQVYLTTLEGTYETFWDISGLGSDGLFDNFFIYHSKAATCANEKPKDVTMFTCKIKVEHEVVLTGYCNGVVNGTENCDPFKEGYELVNFKVVDPSDLFPSVNDPAQVPSYNGETYGYNWVVDPEGQAALGSIQQTGRDDLTYAPQNLSYSFKLTPQDMVAIKDYNTQQVENGAGGYSDFTLKCDCPSDPLPVKSTISCSKCKSPFVENLANGKVVYTHGQANVSGWSGRESLGTVRNGNHW